MKIIGITGTLGAGKGTIVEYLVNSCGFVHFSVRSWLSEEIIKRQLPALPAGMQVNRDTLTSVANELRQRYGSSYIVDQIFKSAQESGRDCVIESIRTPGEIFSLREKETFYLFAVDAEPKIRYERILKRRSETDHITFRNFLMNEKREMDSADPAHQNIGECMAMADFVFYNNGTVEELFHKVQTVMDKLN